MRPKTYVRNNKYSALCKLNYHKKRAQNNQNTTGDNSVASNKEGKGAKFTAGINLAHKFLEDSQGGKYGNPDPQAEQKQEEKVNLPFGLVRNRIQHSPACLQKTLQF